MDEIIKKLEKTIEMKNEEMKIYKTIINVQEKLLTTSRKEINFLIAMSAFFGMTIGIILAILILK
jgi:hypothetical protein